MTISNDELAHLLPLAAKAMGYKVSELRFRNHPGLFVVSPVQSDSWDPSDDILQCAEMNAALGHDTRWNELVEKQKYILSLERKLAEAKKNAAKWREYEDEIRLTMDPRCVRVVVECVREDGLIYRNGELLLKSDAKSIGRHVGEKLAEAVMETATAEMDRPGSIAFPTADTRWVDTYAPDGAFVKRVVSHPTTRKD